MLKNFFTKLLGSTKDVAPSESTESKQLTPDPRKKYGRRESPKEIDWSRVEYIPFPPSPPAWEVDGRDEFHREDNDPTIGPVFQAGFNDQHSKVIRLATRLSLAQRQGRVGDLIAKSYRKLIIQRMKAGQFASAAKRCLEMFEMVPQDVQDVDRRRFNRILKQMDKLGKKHGYTREDVKSTSSYPLFELLGCEGWTLVGERKLNVAERPNPKFRIVAINNFGIWMLDHSGSSLGKPDVKSVLRRLDRADQSVVEKPLNHDVYRISIGSRGASTAIMDSSGILHIYDAALNPIMERNLQQDPRVVDHFCNVDTNYWGDFRTQVRAVDVDPEGDRFLFTLADEAWCCTISGRTIWGAVMPLNEGWKRMVGRTESFGVGHEIEQALRLFDLTLPVNPIDIRRKFRVLAMANHPDRNAGNPEAAEKMKALNRAFQVLTGVDPNTLRTEESDVTYFARTGPDHVMELEGFRIEMTMTGGIPQDWVYAASFASADGGTYVATYSGKVILLSEEGHPLLVFDIGTCPTQIVEVGRYTYFLTPTRLYVVEDRAKLAAFLDVFMQGQLLVSVMGFGLLTSKKLQWFNASGMKVGEFLTRDPIRTIYPTEGGVVVQTRQHQVEVLGLAL